MVSPRIVSARLKLVSAVQCLANGLCRSHDVFATFVCLLPFVFLVIGSSAL